MLSRRAFTMLELLVVVTILAILAGGSIAVVGVLKNKSNRFRTTKMISDEIVLAITSYLGQWPHLGDTKSSEFRAAPWQYIYTRPKRTALGEMTELSPKRLVKASVGSKSCEAVQRPEQGTHVLDYFGANTDNLLNFIVIEGGEGRTRFAKAIEIRSSAGTPSRPEDDILFRWVANGQCDKATPSFNPGDAGKFVMVEKVMGKWPDPLDLSPSIGLDDTSLQRELSKSK